MMANSQLQAEPALPTLPPENLEGTALDVRTHDAEGDRKRKLGAENEDIERRIFAIAPVCAKLAEYASQAKAFESSVCGSIVQAHIKSLKTNLLDMMQGLLDLRKDNDLAIKSMPRQYNSINHSIKKKTEETDLECSGRSLPDMTAELQSMKGPLSIFIDVLVVFGNLVYEIKKIDMEGSDGVPGDTSAPSCRLEIEPLKAILEHLMKVPGMSATETEASSGVTPGDAVTTVPSPIKSPTSHDTAKTIPNHTNGVGESKLPEGWVGVCGDNI